MGCYHPSERPQYEMAPRRRCVVCGSKQWRKEPSSGLITCSEGHVLENYRNETSEVNELGPHTVRKRALKTGRKKKERMSKADPKLYHGDRARYHYYQCLQLLLRLQIAALIDAWHLPPEYEIICKDLWTLHLCLLPNSPPAEPYHYLVEQYGGKRDTESTQPSDPSAKNQDGPTPDIDESGSDSDPDSSSSSDEASEQDDEMDRLLKENSEVSSSETDEDPSATQLSGHVQGRKKKKDTNKSYESPAANLAVLTLACWTMRVPIIYTDIIKLIECYDLPYLDPIRLLPDSLALHLTKQTKQALSPHFAPTTMHVHKLTSRLAKLIYRQYGIYTPECNAAPILWRAVKHMNGAPTLYVLAKKLSHVISVTLTLHRTLSPVLKRIKPLDPEYHKYDNAPVEVSLAAAIIVVLKLVYGLDGKKREPRERDDPACAMPSFQEWLEAIKCRESREGGIRERLFETGADMPSAVDLDDDMLDSYLNFCEKVLLPSNASSQDKDGNIVFRDFFPLQSRPNSCAYSRNINANGSQSAASNPMPATSLPSTSPDLWPGQSYRIYHSSDVLGTLPEEYELIVQRLAKWTGVEEQYVCGVVERFERRLVRWWDKIRKEERQRGGGNNVDDEGSEQEG